MSLNRPNVVIPLAVSYNERGLDGFSNTVTSGLDQRKINSIYNVITNSASGERTIYLCKRPGYADSGATFGTSGQVAYLVSHKPSNTILSSSEAWVFSVSGNDINVSDTAGTTTIVTAAGYVPSYISKTSISGTETSVLLLFHSSKAVRAFYSTTRATWTEITDATFTTPALAGTVRGRMLFMDGFSFFLDSSRKIYNSAINSISSWPASNYIIKQVQQDNPTIFIRHGKKLLAFGDSSCEIFVNKGNPTGSPLISYANFDIGAPKLETGSYHANCSGHIYFIGRETRHARGLGVYKFDGDSFSRVSSSAIEKIINSLAFDTSENIFSIDTVSVYGINGVSLSLTAVTAATQRSIIYFPELNDWFEWNSTVFCMVNNGTQHLGVGTNQHKLYELFPASATYQDAGVDFTWTHQFQLPSLGNERKFMPMIALKGDTARSAQSINVEFSDDDYQTFSTARSIDMTSKAKMLTRCGSWEGDRIIRLSYTGPNEIRLTKLLARIE